MTSATASPPTKRLPSYLPQLRCCTAKERVDWVREARKVPRSQPRADFCREADPDWCIRKRAAGKCFHTEKSFADLQAHVRREMALPFDDDSADPVEQKPKRRR